MNPLTLVKRIQKINSTEAALGISEDASWHAKYKDSAYVYVGGIPFDLTEGDLLAVFAQYGEVVDVNLVRDKGTGKSKGFAFLAYEDQRSTILAVDNLNGAKLLGRIVRVDHVSKYKKKEEEEDEEKERQKREARGVCRAYQRGDCNRGAGCKFSHDEQRNANTGWGPKNSDPRWDHDKYDGPSKSHKKIMHLASDQTREHGVKEAGLKSKSRDKDGRSLRLESNADYSKHHQKQTESSVKDEDRQGNEKQSERHRKHTSEKHSRRHKIEPNLDSDRDELRSEKRLRHDRDSSSRSKREEDEEWKNKREHK